MCFRTISLLAAGLVLHCCCDDAAADINVQQMRNRLADLIRGDEYRMSSRMDGLENPGDEPLLESVRRQSRDFIGRAVELVDDQIGWLRPESTRERAIAWVAVALTMPWLMAGWLMPLLESRFRILRTLVVLVWCGLALWLAWSIWGVDAGRDLFTSTMIVGVPVLLFYYAFVAGSVARQSDAASNSKCAA